MKGVGARFSYYVTLIFSFLSKNHKTSFGKYLIGCYNIDSTVLGPAEDIKK